MSRHGVVGPVVEAKLPTAEQSHHAGMVAEHPPPGVVGLTTLEQDNDLDGFLAIRTNFPGPVSNRHKTIPSIQKIGGRDHLAVDLGHKARDQRLNVVLSLPEEIHPDCETVHRLDKAIGQGRLLHREDFVVAENEVVEQLAVTDTAQFAVFFVLEHPVGGALVPDAGVLEQLESSPQDCPRIGQRLSFHSVDEDRGRLPKQEVQSFQALLVFESSRSQYTKAINGQLPVRAFAHLRLVEFRFPALAFGPGDLDEQRKRRLPIAELGVAGPMKKRQNLLGLDLILFGEDLDLGSDESPAGVGVGFALLPRFLEVEQRGLGGRIKTGSIVKQPDALIREIVAFSRDSSAIGAGRFSLFGFCNQLPQRSPNNLSHGSLHFHPPRIIEVGPYECPKGGERNNWVDSHPLLFQYYSTYNTEKVNSYTPNTFPTIMPTNMANPPRSIIRSARLNAGTFEILA